MSDQTTSHSGEAQETVLDERTAAVNDAFAAFGIDTPSKQSEASDSRTESQDDSETDAPDIERQPEPKKIKVKVDKEEREFDISDDKLPEYVQKAYALDKERERKTELQKNLERAAKLAGFEKVDEYLSNLDRLEQEAKQREQDKFRDLRQQLRDEAEDNGLDPEKLEAYLDNHPLFKEAQAAIQEKEQAELTRIQQTEQEQLQSKWKALYDTYPDLLETAKMFGEGNAPDWYTPDMQSRIERGYDPVDAYELAHKSKIAERNKQMAKQQAIKEQRLGLRSQVETQSAADLEPEVPDGLASAFSLFGLPVASAKKYVKK